MIKSGALPENINHFLPDVREYFDFSRKEMDIFNARVLVHYP